MRLVVDNFLANPEVVRQSAIQAGFGTWRPAKGEVGSSVYDGMGFWGAHASLLKALSKAIGQPVYPNDMFFRVTNLSTEGAYVHSDREAGDYTAIVYLSQHEAISGTAFYKHRESGLTRMPPFNEMVHWTNWEDFKAQMVKGSDEDWEQLEFVEGKYNRALIFEAPFFHSRHPKHGFGTDAESGRLIWATHFFL